MPFHPGGDRTFRAIEARFGNNLAVCTIHSDTATRRSQHDGVFGTYTIAALTSCHVATGPF
jgi:hypothetical protein